MARILLTCCRSGVKNPGGACIAHGERDEPFLISAASICGRGSSKLPPASRETYPFIQMYFSSLSALYKDFYK
jgi:hypothetical protein